MLTYEVEPVVLAPYVPSGTELDSWHGKVFISLVGFRFVDTRVLGVPIPFHRDFEELNLRFYVRRVHDGEPRRGVTFIRELAPRRAVAAVARAVYNEPYLAVPMRSHIVAESAPRVEYAWRYGDRWHSCAATGVGAPSVPGPGTVEQFITERYWGYTRQRDGGTVEYRVEHARWMVWPAQTTRVDADWDGLYGSQLAAFLGGDPCSAFIADGSAVTVFRPTRLDDGPS